MDTEGFEGARQSSRPPPLPEGAEGWGELHPGDVRRDDELLWLRSQLQAMREGYRELNELSPVGYVLNAPSGIVEANRAAERLFGVEQGGLVGRALSSFVVPEDLDELLLHEHRVLKNPGIHRCELALLVHGGERRDVRLESTRTASGQWRSAIADVSEQKRLERQLVDSARRDAVGPVARGLAHDVCHVLNSILNEAERVLARPADVMRVQELATQIKTLALHGGSLVQGVIQRARPDSGVGEIADLNEIVMQAETLLRRVAGDGVQTRIALRAARPWVTISRSEIEQVLSNLVSNARDAMAGRGELRIETRDALPADEQVLHGAEQCIVLSVSDTGRGMDAALQARAFEPYFTTKPAGQGTGIGLPTVYNIVKAAGGEVRVRSEIGKGTTMELYLPRQGSAAADQRPSQPMLIGVAPTRLLVVEEDPLVSLATSCVLEQAGYEVLRARSGREAMVVLGAYSDLKLVVSDVTLPDVTGFELVRAIRAACPNVRTLLTTTDDPKTMTEVPLPTGTEILQKPFGHGVLVERIRRTLATSNERLPMVLVVDDDQSALLAYEELLTEQRFHVVSAASAGEALEWLVAHPGKVSALVTDLHLADSDGVWLAHELRELGEDAPVLFLTGASPDDPLLREALRAPRTALLAKPAETSLLAVTVRRLMAG